jgi:hypothetical protein
MVPVAIDLAAAVFDLDQVELRVVLPAQAVALL